MTQLQPGDLAPDFELPDADGNAIGLASFAGRNVIVYFYPAALTPGCTREAVDFSEHLPQFHSAGYDVVGISPDTPERLSKFRSTKDLTVTLLADPTRETIDAYGAWGEKVLYGRRMTGIIRSTVLVQIDASGKGTIQKAWYNVRATGHVERLAAELGVELA